MQAMVISAAGYLFVADYSSYSPCYQCSLPLAKFWDGKNGDDNDKDYCILQRKYLSVDF